MISSAKFRGRVGAIAPVTLGHKLGLVALVVVIDKEDMWLWFTRAIFDRMLQAREGPANILGQSVDIDVFLNGLTFTDEPDVFWKAEVE